MFELFGSDSDKKEEIDKNMDKIKDMVGSSSDTDRSSQQQSPGQDRQQGPPGSQQASTGTQDNTSSPAPVQAEGRQPPQGSGSPRDSQDRQELSPGPQQPQDSQGQAPQQSPAGQQEQDRQTPAPARPQSSSTRSPDQQDAASGPSRQEGSSDSRATQQPTPDEQEPDQDESEPEPPRRDDIPEAPQTKEIEVPEIEKGPLFIRVKKFKEAKKMIHEMQNLADDVETDMGGLQNTLEEDKDVQKDLKGRLKKLRDSMKSIHTIVSP